MYCYLCSLLFCTFLYPFPYLTWVYFNSDEMGNKGAFITMGTDTKPNYTTYDAVVSSRFWFCYRRPDGWRGGGGSGDTPVIWVTCPRGISTPLLLFSYSASPRRETHGLCELLDVYVWIHVTGMRVPPYNLMTWHIYFNQSSKLKRPHLNYLYGLWNRLPSEEPSMFIIYPQGANWLPSSLNILWLLHKWSTRLTL